MISLKPRTEARPPDAHALGAKEPILAALAIEQGYPLALTLIHNPKGLQITYGYTCTCCSGDWLAASGAPIALGIKRAPVPRCSQHPG